MHLFQRKSRKYPIKRDEYGRSARQRAFELFKEGKRPAQIYKPELIPGIKKNTLYRYYEDWKKLEGGPSYATLKKLMKVSPEFTEGVVLSLSKNLGMTRQEVIRRMQRPWGLMRALKGAWPNYRLAEEQGRIESRLQKALELITIAERFRDNPDKLMEAIEELLFDK